MRSVQQIPSRSEMKRNPRHVKVPKNMLRKFVICYVIVPRNFVVLIRINQVKRSVLLPTYRRFQEILRSYKAGTIDIKQLIDELIVIFGGDDVEEGVELIKVKRLS